MLRILVKSAGGKPLETFFIGMIPNKFAEMLREMPYIFPVNTTKFRRSDLDEACMASLAVLEEPFVLQVEAPRHEFSRVGPFFPATLPDPLEIVLEPVPGISGVVRLAGKPVAGAAVNIHKKIPAGASYRVDSFLCRSRRDSAASGTTDSEGRFTLWLSQSGSFYVRAEAEEYAVCDVGPLYIDHKTGMEDIEIAITRGGAIEGRVVAAPGEEPRDIIMGICRGDGIVLKKEVATGGLFRFERLAPGPWQVARIKDGSLRGQCTSYGGREDPPESIEWSCIVEDGKTTHCDLVLTEEEEDPDPINMKRRRIRDGR